MDLKGRNFVYLEFKDSSSSKFYSLEKLSSGEWLAKFGRIGSRGQNITYDEKKANLVLREKMTKGYKVIRYKKEPHELSKEENDGVDIIKLLEDI